jgi:hypothetical protein
VVISALTRSAEPVLDPPDAGHRLLPAVLARTAAVSVVQVLRAVKRGGQVHVLLGAEVEDLLVQERQVGCDHEREVLAVVGVHPLRLGRNPADEREVEQRLTALKLDLQLRRRRPEGQLKRLARGLLGHVELAFRRRLP